MAKCRSVQCLPRRENLPRIKHLNPVKSVLLTRLIWRLIWLLYNLVAITFKLIVACRCWQRSSVLDIKWVLFFEAVSLHGTMLGFGCDVTGQALQFCFILSFPLIIQLFSIRLSNRSQYAFMLSAIFNWCCYSISLECIEALCSKMSEFFAIFCLLRTNFGIEVITVLLFTVFSWIPMFSI